MAIKILWPASFSAYRQRPNKNVEFLPSSELKGIDVPDNSDIPQAQAAANEDAITGAAREHCQQVSYQSLEYSTPQRSAKLTSILSVRARPSVSGKSPAPLAVEVPQSRNFLRSWTIRPGIASRW
ncbi:hypothetical protein PG997_005527 [Apiospora hydei]|uniref:Uncharacterized protein n=1 Tax=Apiospora hydei TaxID=1337664 RepID=A0ABR1WL78_9PEZI